MALTFFLMSFFLLNLIKNQIFFKKWLNENKLLGVIFFENKLLPQLDVVFDSEWNDRIFSSLAPPGGEKNFFYKMTSLVGVGLFSPFFRSNESLKKVLQF